MTEEGTTAEQEVDVVEPIILDLGKKSNKLIKRLKKGKGKLWGEVQDVLDEVGNSLGDELAGKVILPVVVIYSKKPKRRLGRRLLRL